MLENAQTELETMKLLGHTDASKHTEIIVVKTICYLKISWIIVELHDCTFNMQDISYRLFLHKCYGKHSALGIKWGTE